MEANPSARVATKPEKREESMITIGIPVKDNAWCIEGLLKAIEDMEYTRKRVKLVFVDDYSKDGTFEAIKEWRTSAQGQYHDVVAIQESSNIPKARNICIKNFEGDHILFWDSDVIPPEGLLREMVSMLEADESLGMIGADYVSEEQDKQVGLYGEVILNRRTHAVWMGFTLIRGEVFELIGDFNEFLDIGEDTEFGMRLAEKTKLKTIWAPRPVLHVRPTGKRESDRSFVQWLSYNLRGRGAKYAEAFSDLPLLLRIRVFYYGALPFMLVLSIVLAFYYGPLVLLSFVAYLLPGWYLAIRGSNLKRGTLSFFLFNMPTGIALSYGTLLHALKPTRKGSP